jgi:hypothetical protein
MTAEFCDPCFRDDVQAKATTMCTDCEEFLCDDCTRAHRRNKLSLAHVLLDVKQIGPCRSQQYRHTYSVTFTRQRL